LRCATFERGGDLAAGGEAVVVVESRAAAGSGAGVHEAAARLPLRRPLLLWLGLLRPGGGDGDAARGEGERPRVTCQVDKQTERKAHAFSYSLFATFVSWRLFLE